MSHFLPCPWRDDCSGSVFIPVPTEKYGSSPERAAPLRIAEYLILFPLFESGKCSPLPEDIQVTRPPVSMAKPLEELSYDELLSELRYRRAGGS